MENQRKPWVKPKIVFIPAGTPKYNEIMAAMETEKSRQTKANSTEVSELCPSASFDYFYGEESINQKRR